MALKIVVFYGSVRSDRQGIKAARFMVKKCQERGHEVALIDPLEYRLPLLDKMYKEYDPAQAPEVLQRMAKLIIPADAYIVVSGEYNHTVPPALANLMDHFLEEYFWKPSAIVCYSAGAFGGVTHNGRCFQELNLSAQGGRYGLKDRRLLWFGSVGSAGD